MTDTVWEIIWSAGSLPVWIALELAEAGLYIYLVTGILPDLRNMGRKEKIFCGILFAVMAGMVCMKYRIGSVFSAQVFLYGVLVLIIGTWIACRGNLLLGTGIALTYSGFIMLLTYTAVFVLSLIYSGSRQPDIYMAMRGHVNEVFCVLRLVVLCLLIPVVRKFRCSDICRQIGEYRTLLLIVGAVLSALVLEYQNFLEYGFTYSSTGFPAVTSALRNSFLGLMTSVILAAAAGMLFFKNRNIRRENDFLLMKEEMEQQKYKELSAAVEKNRELVHDVKNHYLVIREYVRDGDYESLAGYIDGLHKDFVRTDSWVYTGNFVLDLILGQKRLTAQGQGFSFELQASPLSGLPFSDREICSLFGNLLDNAIEACERARQRKEEKAAAKSAPGSEGIPEIMVKIEQQNQMLFIEISNSTDEIPEQKERGFQSSKKDPSLHGYGLKSVERIVEDHDGVIRYDADGRSFTVTVTFFDVE